MGVINFIMRRLERDVFSVLIKFSIEAAFQNDVVGLEFDELEVEKGLQLRTVHKIIYC